MPEFTEKFFGYLQSCKSPQMPATLHTLYGLVIYKLLQLQFSKFNRKQQNLQAFTHNG
jgi:hypothetical protein